MDRIARALELARQQRTKLVPVAKDEAPDHIEYTETRKVEVDHAILRENRIIVGYGKEPLADAYKLLRTRVLRRMRQNGWTSLGITSASMGDGKTLTAINLALAIAMEPNQSVLLVDTDLRRPSVHKRFGIELEMGLEAHLGSGVKIEELLVNPGFERFTLLPCAQPLAGSSEVLASKRMGRLVDELKGRYPSRMVIFDLPPVLVSDDVAAFSTHLDSVLLVVGDGKTQSRELARAVELLEGVELLGTVLNRTEEHSKGQYDYY